MPGSLCPFYFDDPVLLRAPVFTVELSPGIAGKPQLLEELSKRLSFPGYFGENWDALEECLRDLSWLPPGVIVVKHAGLPLAGDSPNLATYLSILADAVRAWSASSERELVVVFPAAVRGQVVTLLGAC